MPGLTASRRRASTFFYLQDEARTNTVGDNPSSESHGLGTEREQSGDTVHMTKFFFDVFFKRLFVC